MDPVKILFITTSRKTDNTAETPGLWLEELAAPYYLFKDAGAIITIASPNGGPVHLNPKSQSIIIATRRTKRFLKDMEAMDFLSTSRLLEEVKAYDFDVIFLTSIYSAAGDIAGNKMLKDLLESFNNENKLIGAVCYGVVSLLSLQNDKGELLIKGKKITSFSTSEEMSSGLTRAAPFLLETQLLSLGALYSKADDYVSHVLVDGNIITGQNPSSSEEVAKKIAIQLQYNKHMLSATTAL
jgi:putative intracellular protease/amidase